MLQTIVFSYILFGISNTFLDLSICFSTLQVQKPKNQFIQAEKEEKGMEEKVLWQDENDWIFSGIKKPGIITYKKNLMKQGKELFKTNEDTN